MSGAILENRPGIPHLQVVLKDLFSLEEMEDGIPDEERKKKGPIGDKLVGFHRYRKQWSVLAKVLQCQRIPYGPELVKGDPQISMMLYSSMDTQVLTEEVLFERSFEYEPKSEEHAFEIKWNKLKLEEKGLLVAAQQRILRDKRIPIEEARRRRAEIEEKKRKEEEES